MSRSWQFVVRIVPFELFLKRKDVPGYPEGPHYNKHASNHGLPMVCEMQVAVRSRAYEIGTAFLRVLWLLHGMTPGIAELYIRICWPPLRHDLEHAFRQAVMDRVGGGTCDEDGDSNSCEHIQHDLVFRCQIARFATPLHWVNHRVGGWGGALRRGGLRPKWHTKGSSVPSWLGFVA